MVKGLSSTRWAAHARATKALRLNFKNIHDTLNEIAEDDHQKSAARDEAKSLAKKLNRFETAFLAIIWDTVLQRFDITSRALQTVELDLVTAVELLQSLIDFVSNLRSQYKHLESKAKSLSLSQQYTVTRQVKRTTPADDTDEPTLVSNAGENRFRETFFVIIDKLISALQQRHAVYKETSTYFGFLTQLDTFRKSLHCKQAADEPTVIHSRKESTTSFSKCRHSTADLPYIACQQCQRGEVIFQTWNYQEQAENDNVGGET